MDERPVTANRVRKSVGAETTFEQDLEEYTTLVDSLRPLVEKVWNHCERTGILGKTVTLKVKYADFSQITRSRSVGGRIAERLILERIAVELLDSVMPLTKGIRLLGVSLSGLHRKEAAANGATKPGIIKSQVHASLTMEQYQIS